MKRIPSPEIITYIGERAYAVNLAYEPPEDSCLNCHYWINYERGCGDWFGKRSRYSECQVGRPKSLWTPRWEATDENLCA